MGDNLEETVDAYWQWHRSGREREEGFVGRGDTITAGWNLEALLWEFRLLVPTRLRFGGLPGPPSKPGDYDDWSLGDDLPFPPECILSLSQEGLHLLSDAFGYSGPSRYWVWADHFGELNRSYSNRKEEATRILLKTKELLPLEKPGLLSVVVLAASRGAQLDQHKVSFLRDADRFRQLSLDVNHDVEKLLECLRLLRTLSEADDSSPVGRMRKGVGTRLGRIGLGVRCRDVLARNFDRPMEERMFGGPGGPHQDDELTLLNIFDLIEAVIECEAEDQISLWQQALELTIKMAPGDGVKDHHSPLVHYAFVAVKSYVGQLCGQRGSAQLTGIIFQEWGLMIDPRAAIKATQRRKKSQI